MSSSDRPQLGLKSDKRGLPNSAEPSPRTTRARSRPRRERSPRGDSMRSDAQPDIASPRGDMLGGIDSYRENSRPSIGQRDSNRAEPRRQDTSSQKRTSSPPRDDIQPRARSPTYRSRNEGPSRSRSASRRRQNQPHPSSREAPPEMPSLSGRERASGPAASFDAMLNDLDDMFASTSVTSDRSNQRAKSSINYSSMTDALDELIDQNPTNSGGKKSFKERFELNRSREGSRLLETPRRPSVDQIASAPSPVNENLTQLEQMEIEKSRRELEELKAEKKAAARREAEMVAAERERRTAQDREKRSRDSGEFSLLNRVEPNPGVF